MITRSSPCSPPDPAIPRILAPGVDTPPDDPAIPPAPPPAEVRTDPPESAVRQDDPLEGLLRTVVTDRPLEDVVQLVTLLEGDPAHADLTGDVLRAVGRNRSVDEVTRLVTLLTGEPRLADRAEEAIRAAAECRPLDEVSRLVELLHRGPLEPHCGRAAVRAAGVGRPVEDVARLIGRLATARAARTPAPLGSAARTGAAPATASLTSLTSWCASAEPPRTGAPERGGPSGVPDRAASGAGERDAWSAPTASPAGAPEGCAAAGATTGAGGRPGSLAPDASAGSTERAASSESSASSASSEGAGRSGAAVPSVAGGRTAWAAALVFVLCGVAHAPRQWGGAPPLASAVPALCLLLAFALTIPASRLAAASAGFVGAAVLAAGPVLDPRFGARLGIRRLSGTLYGTPVPSWLPGTVAAAAALAALTVLVLVLAGTRRTARRQPGATGRSTS